MKQRAIRMKKQISLAGTHPVGTLNYYHIYNNRSIPPTN